MLGEEMVIVWRMEMERRGSIDSKDGDGDGGEGSKW